MNIDKTKILKIKSKLENHSLLTTNTIQTISDLRIFMEHHVFAVWDFMSLVKNVQHSIVPSGGVWLPTEKNRSDIARMINEIIICEETDLSLDGSYNLSHFDLYVFAMKEVGADTKKVINFISDVKKYGIDYALNTSDIPELSRDFMRDTFNTIKLGPHHAAASFCYGRENVIPEMFKKILDQLQLNSLDVPKFNYYLDRHIQVDGEDHGPKSEKIVELLCENDIEKIFEAEETAIRSIQSRIRFFTGIENILIS